MKKPIQLSDEKLTAFTLQATEEYKHALDYRARRHEKWTKTNELYYGKKRKSLVTRANIHFPVLHGAVETLLSKIDGAIIPNVIPQTTSDAQRANYINKSWESDADLGDWESVDLYTKKEMLLYGRGVEMNYSTSKSGYTDVRESVQCIDFLIDPLAGGLKPFEYARFCGRDNIIKTKYDLEDKDFYDQEAVKKAVGQLSSDRRADDRYNSHSDKKMMQGLVDFAHVSGDAANLTAWFTTFEGVRWYALIEMRRGVVIKAQPLKEMVENDEFPFSSYAAFADASEFWSPAPAELFHDINYTQNVLVSQLVDNSAQRNYGMKAFDQNMIPDPKFLDPRPSGRIPVNGKPQDAIMDISFPSIGENISLLNFLRLNYSTDTGVTDQVKGTPTSKRMSATEFEGLIEQVADRVYTMNRLYFSHYRRLVRLYASGLKENLTTARKIEIMGAGGVRELAFKGSDLAFERDFRVEVSLEDAQKRAKEREEQLAYIVKSRENPRINQQFLDEKEAELLGFSEDEIQRLTTKLPDGTWRSVSEAAEEEEMLLKKTVEPNKAATTAHVQHHLDFARNTKDLTASQRSRIIEHAQAELQIASENMALSVSKALGAAVAQQVENAGQPQMPPGAPQGAPQGTPPGAPAMV